MIESTFADSLDQSAEAYVKLVLALGEHDPAYVDAYYGPPEWREAVRADPPNPGAIHTQALALRRDLPQARAGDDSLDALRLAYLSTQLGALAAHAESLDSPGDRDFDREARALYDTSPPRQAHAEFDGALAELEALLPGPGPLHERVEAFNRGYQIPEDKLEPVFAAAIAGCRERTLEYLDLPADENFTLEYVRDKPWSGYNWYQGDAHSLIQINISLPIRIDRAIDLGCHEGYPGHHSYSALLERELVRRRGWVEFSVYPLFSPQSLIAEGTANYGIELAFPGGDKLAFEKSVLYPLAGLDPATADKYDAVQRITARLAFARNQTARLYINGEIDREQAVALSRKYGPSSLERAEQSVRFIDTYGAYVINYNWGEQLVREYVERDTATAAQRWKKFAALLASPRLPSALE